MSTSVDTIPVILDSRPDYVAAGAAEQSLLTLPLAHRSVIQELLSHLDRHQGDVYVLPDFEPSLEYVDAINELAPRAMTVVGPHKLRHLIERSEPADKLLLINPMHWPLDGLVYDEFFQLEHPDHAVVHGVVISRKEDNTVEHVHCDEHNRVRRISRYFDQLTSLNIDAVALSILPVASAVQTEFSSLAGFRASLARAGVISQDMRITSPVLDLNRLSSLLTLNEHDSISALSRTPPASFRRTGDHCLAANKAKIHPSASLTGPVIVQKRARIEQGARIIGPTVIAENAVVQSGALIAQAVIGRGATVAHGATVRHTLVTGKHVRTSAADELNPRTVVDFHDSVTFGADASAAGTLPDRASKYSGVKLAFDCTVATMSLVLLSPLLAVIAVAIKLDSKGPVLFGHDREGRFGKVFRCWKFRTMCDDAHAQQRALYETSHVDGPQFKVENDPRVTRVGAWLRATNLDEIPQLINVLLGQMSLVGPRPSPFRENQICLPWRRARLSVRPGITGLWQICRDQRDQSDFHQWIAYDIMYVRHMSPWLDFKILLATMLTLGGLWNVKASFLVPNDRMTQRSATAAA